MTRVDTTTTTQTTEQESAMRHTLVTYAVGREEENAALVRAVFEDLAQTRPAGLRYAVFRLPDSRQYIHLYTDAAAHRACKPANFHCRSWTTTTRSSWAA